MLAWRDSTLAMLRARRVKGVAIAVTEKLIEHPTVTVKNIADSNSVSVQAANNAVTRLVDFGVLAEITGRSYNRVFSAPAVFDILFRTGSAGQTPQAATVPDDSDGSGSMRCVPRSCRKLRTRIVGRFPTVTSARVRASRRVRSDRRRGQTELRSGANPVGIELPHPAALPWGFDCTRVVGGPHPIDGTGRFDPGDHCQRCDGAPGAATSTSAGDLDALVGAAVERLGQRSERFSLI